MDCAYALLPWNFAKLEGGNEPALLDGAVAPHAVVNCVIDSGALGGVRVDKYFN